MNIRRALIIFSSLALTANMSVAVYADQASNDSSTDRSFHYVGFRSDGAPVLTSHQNSFRNENGNGNQNGNGNESGNVNGGDSGNGNSSDDQSTQSDVQSGLNTFASNFAAAFEKGFSLPVGSPAPNPIYCHSTCTTLTGTISLIPVFVGGWSGSDVTTWNSVLGNIVTSLGSGAANSVALAGHVFNTTTLYYTSQGLTPPSLQWVSNTNITDPTVTNVSDAGVATEINSFIAANPAIVPSGTTPVYIYIGASSTLLTSGFGTTYCGWHSYGLGSQSSVPFMAIQDFTSIYNKTCAAQTTTPNGNVGLDSMASIMVHEIDETLTDPFFTAWQDASGYENADKCAWSWGPLKRIGLALYDITLGSLNYLIQTNWLEHNLVTLTGSGAGKACSLIG